MSELEKETQKLDCAQVTVKWVAPDTSAVSRQRDRQRRYPSDASGMTVRETRKWHLQIN